ncbi:MAG: hypothetical protein GY870_01940 [archaeon]|nr:hypothetical protein [archaeon]
MSKKKENVQGITIRVPCPTCNKTGSIKVTKEDLLRAGNGLTVISVPANLVCEHAFQFFVDRNGAVRGCESTDFEVKSAEKKKSKDEIKIAQKDSIYVIRSMVDNEIFLKCMRTCLNNKNIICISEHWYIKKHFIPLFEKIFENYPPKIVIYSSGEYDEISKKIKNNPQNENTFIFNADLGAIIQEPFKNIYHWKNFRLENSMMELIKTKDEDEIFNSLHFSIDKIFERLPFIKEDIKRNIFKNRRQMDKWFKANYNKDIKFNSDSIIDILKNRFEFDAEQYFPEKSNLLGLITKRL